MKKTKENILIIISSVALVLICFAIYYFVFNYKKTKENIVILKQKELEEEKKNSELDIIKTNIKNTTEDVEFLESLIIKPDDIVGFLEDIESKSKKIGLNSSIESVSSRASTADGGNDKEDLVINIKGGGSFQKVFDFMKVIDNLPYKVSFEDFEIKKFKSLNTKTKDTQVYTDGDWLFNITFFILKDSQI